MSLSNNGEVQVLDEIFNAGGGAFPSANVYVALFTGDPGETGASNEVVGGSYARQQADFSAAAGGFTTNLANISFTGMPAVGSPGVVAWGIFDAASSGNCFWVGWFSTVGRVGVVDAAGITSNDIVSPAHGFVANDRVVLETIDAETTPTGITLGTLYYVLSAGLTTDTFNLSGSSGGSEVDISAKGVGMFRKVEGKPTDSGDTFRIGAGDLSIYLD